ncbi:MAG TPA: flagellin, partial [Pseudomonadales bacterium]|nr:flagellin [Pseudomonadales bacterium]
MPLIINTNISALNAQRQLVKSGDEMSQAMERLSSGKRINTAADDAAGMAISSRMTSSIRGLNQAVRNANDGISLIQTAGGALEESTNILQRMRELSIQSANGIYTDANRVSLNAEVEQLKQELTRIATTTSFNGLKVLDGTLGDIALQIGTEANETITLRVGSGFDAESLGKEESALSSGTFRLA